MCVRDTFVGDAGDVEGDMEGDVDVGLPLLLAGLDAADSLYRRIARASTGHVACKSQHNGVSLVF